MSTGGEFCWFGEAGRRTMTRTTTAVIALFALLAMPGSAAAYTYAERLYGDAMPSGDGRFLALGGAGIASADGPRGIHVNPALVGKTKGIELAFTGLAISAEEARQAPIHDSFDGIIAYNTFALNSNLYDHYTAAIGFSPGRSHEWAPALAVAYGPRLDMSYHYHVQYRDPDTQSEPQDKILYDYYADADGGISAFSVALGQEVIEGVYVGLGVDFLRGDYDLSERRIYPSGSTEADSVSSVRYDDMSGTQFTLGILVEVLPRVDAAAVYRSSYTLAGDYAARPAVGDTLSGRFDYKYPDAVAVGFEYHPRNEIMTTVSFDIEYTRWSDFEDSLTEEVELDDTLEYRLGVEHQFYDDSYARFGFRHQPSYADSRIARSAFCFGLGLDVLGTRLDLGAQLGLREYGERQERVRETTALAMATVTYSF